MKTIHHIEIKSLINDEYSVTISVVSIANTIFYEFVKIKHKREINEIEQRCDNYKEALKQFLKDVTIYANHTALMNL